MQMLVHLCELRQGGKSLVFLGADDQLGHFRQIDPLSDDRGMSASLRSRPNFRTAANRRVVPIAF
jgi:hypothetical protein